MNIPTQTVTRSPFPLAEIAKITNVLCSDGIFRTVHATSSADTFFSIPARVKVKGKTVSGFLTKECLDGSSVELPNDPAIWKFIAYQYGKNSAILPRGAYRESN